MGGLIPLMLSTSKQSSLISPPLPSPPLQPTTSFSAPTQMTRPRHLRRLSLSTSSVSPLVLPHTQTEWRRTISEVKRQHFAKMHRACWTRCNDVLDGITDASQVEPVYLIYLHFYAATSIVESCAHPLPSTSTSSFRINLLQQARAHFDRAASLISAAEDSVVKRVRPGSVSSSRGSSCHSPAGSISSRAWSPDTLMSSPTNSVCSFDDLSAKSQVPARGPKRVKKVSFSLPHERPFSIIPEPIVRPDSPTLGFDDEYFHSGIARQELPDLPRPKFEEVELPLQVMSENDDRLSMNEDMFTMARSVDRYFDNLSGLKAQLASHSSSLDSLLSANADHTQTLRALAETSPNKSASSAEDLRALDRQARIERLRKNGWQRKRFDARRYEELCETVLSELA
ncbi:hypothetical protein B0H63DRAFT_39220 [Podospora didyma]|uniref:Uncharacterized protein n=1 Tax=Podospora didyma TaxID=330526 RepID=A0AAE0P6G7_9PEZI|nr:hypothetical protein B0H63DRAFT_39220 [Podospora didyma]